MLLVGETIQIDTGLQVEEVATRAYQIEGDAGNRYFSAHVRNEGPGHLNLIVEGSVGGGAGWHMIHTRNRMEAGISLAAGAEGQFDFIVVHPYNFWRFSTYNVGGRCRAQIKLKTMNGEPLGGR